MSTRTVRLLLIRHPRPVVETGVCYGRLDLHPDPDELAALVARLRGQLPADAPLVSSPLARCARVAEALHAAGWMPPRFDDRLAEMHFGDWEGRRWDDIARHEIDAWRDDVAGFRPPGGETVTEVAERAALALREWTDRHAPDGALAVITHAGVIQTATRRLTGAPLADFGRTRVEYGQVVELRRDADGFRLHPSPSSEA